MFAPICREIFTLSFEIMVILDWTSPLMAGWNKGSYQLYFAPTIQLYSIHFLKCLHFNSKVLQEILPELLRVFGLLLYKTGLDVPNA